MPLDLLPPERQAGDRVTPHVARLPRRRPVTVYDEAPGVQLFEVHETRGDGTGGKAGGGQTDRFGLVDVGLLRGREPSTELSEGRGKKLGALERALSILLCTEGGVGGVGGRDWDVSVGLEAEAEAERKGEVRMCRSLGAEEAMRDRLKRRGERMRISEGIDL